MIEREDIVAAIIAAAGGELVARVRLQKTAYLLERLGLGAKLNFEYHHYGPYSRDLDSAALDARAFGLVHEEYDHRQSDGALFSRFKLRPETAINDEAYGTLGRERATELVKRFVWTNVTVLELAATIDWLWRVEKLKDWRTEIIKRKGKKTQGGRLEKAVELLREIDLPPVSLEHAETVSDQ